MANQRSYAYYRITYDSDILYSFFRSSSFPEAR